MKCETCLFWRNLYMEWRKTAGGRWDYGEQVRIERERLLSAVIAAKKIQPLLDKYVQGDFYEADIDAFADAIDSVEDLLDYDNWIRK